MMELVSRGRDFEASDSRDKVFALLGLANDIDGARTRSLGFQPNYTLEKEEVYANFARALIAKSGNLDILSVVYTFAVRHMNEHTISWMPDLDVSVATIRGLGFPQKYTASASTTVDSKLLLEPSHGQYTLALSGFAVDMAADLIRDVLTFSRDLKLYTSEGRDHDAIVTLWNEYVRPSLSHHHPEEILLQRYIELLTAAGFALPTEFPAHPLGRIIPSRDVPSLTADFAAYWSLLDPGFLDFQDPVQTRLKAQAPLGDPDQFGVLTGKACHERRFFGTAEGRIGLCPPGTWPGDRIVILHGGSVPYVLRKMGCGTWRFIGECYVDGIMFGEAEKMKKEKRVFRIV